VAKVLFVCLHNAGRSQMSEVLFERAAGGLHEARSAGTTPAAHVHETVVAVMREEGFDLSDRRPVIPGKRYVDWDLTDPSGLPVEQVREIRDDISTRVGVLLESLDRNSS
jgi:arsenate reductase